MQEFSSVEEYAYCADKTHCAYLMHRILLSSHCCKERFHQMCVVEAQIHNNPQEVIAWVHMFISQRQSEQEADQQPDVKGFL